MRAQTAAAYVDEKSVKSFLRKVGSVYPQPINISGRGRIWTKETLDQAIDRLTGNPEGQTFDVADFV